MLHRLLHFFQPLLVTLDSIAEFRVDPAFRVAASKVGNLELIVLVYHKIVCISVAPDTYSCAACLTHSLLFILYVSSYPLVH